MTIEKLIEDICFHFRIRECDLWTTNKEESVDARCLLVTILSEQGMTDTDLADMFSKTRQGINKLRSSWSERGKKWQIRMFYEWWKNSEP